MKAGTILSNGAEIIFTAPLPHPVLNKLVLAYWESRSKWITGRASDHSARFGELEHGHYRSTEDAAARNFLDRYREWNGQYPGMTGRWLDDVLYARRKTQAEES